MGTKQLRLSEPEQIKKRVSSFLGKKINIVLQDSTVVFGELKEVSTIEILLLNMRLKKVRYPYSAIAEVYVDSNA
jgi:hypothetical protein